MPSAVKRSIVLRVPIISFSRKYPDMLDNPIPISQVPCLKRRRLAAFQERHVSILISGMMSRENRPAGFPPM
jgi:hypothetical protein